MSHKWFIPHRDTHKKAHLLSWEALIVYILLFALLQVSFSIVGFLKPGILGTTSNIQRQKVIELTNMERSKLGLPPVVENSTLNQAAEAKAANMFEENYWAHFAPSGKSPWDFISGAGYRFTFAGENLAKNFQEADAVVIAWMNSPTHKENIVNPKYREIGIAVEDGILNGQRTTLVVQMFGSTEGLASGANPNTELPRQVVQVPAEGASVANPVVASVETKQQVLIDPFKITKSVGVSLITILAVLLLIDMVILRKRGVLRLGSHHLAHMAILSVAAAAILNASPGSIL